MQNPITFLPAEPSGNTAKQVKNSTNSSENTPNSFKQVLSKEISGKQNTVKDKPADKVENQSIPDDLKRNTSSQPAKIEPIAEDDSKTDAIPLENAQTNGVQLIALVESLAQFSPKTTEKNSATTSPDVPGIDTNSNITQFNPKADPNLLTREKSEVPPPPVDENTLLLVKGIAIDPSSKADQLIALALKNDKNKPEESLQTTKGSGLTTDMIATLKNASKPDQRTDLKVDFKVDVKPDQQHNLKQDLQPDLKAELNTDLKADSKIDIKQDLKASFKIQETANTKEQNVKIAEIAPSAQNFAQQIAVSTGQLNSTTEIEHLNSRVGTPAWNQSVGQKIVWMVAGAEQTAELTLNPPDLGPMQIVLSVNNDQANATFISAHPDVRDALESAMPKLRQMMSDAGVQLSGFSVKSESSNPGAQFAGDRSSSRSKNSETETVTGTSAISSTTNTIKRSTANGIVDTFA